MFKYQQNIQKYKLLNPDPLRVYPLNLIKKQNKYEISEKENKNL